MTELPESIFVHLVLQNIEYNIIIKVLKDYKIPGFYVYMYGWYKNYVCVCVCVYIYIHTHTHTHKNHKMLMLFWVVTSCGLTGVYYLCLQVTSQHTLSLIKPYTYSQIN
jgi:hypothetical protein